MASGLDTSKRDFQVGKVMAWHKKTILKTPEKTDFPNIIPVALQLENGQAAKYGDKPYFMPVAEDDMLPVAPPYCLDTYTIFQPRKACDWVSEVLAGTGYEMASLGMLWNRSFWFISTELSELNSIRTVAGRESKFYLNFSGGLDKMTSPQAELSNILAVCHNTISLSRMSGEMLFKERLTKNFATRLEAGKAEVEKAAGMAKVFAATMESLANKSCSQSQVERIVAGYVSAPDADKLSTRAKNTVQDVATLFKTGRGNNGENEFDLLNAWTEYNTEGTRDGKSKVDSFKRFQSAEFGGNADSKADFANLLTSNRAGLKDVESRGDKLLAISVN
jgi:hypothetical protein